MHWMRVARLSVVMIGTLSVAGCTRIDKPPTMSPAASATDAGEPRMSRAQRVTAAPDHRQMDIGRSVLGKPITLHMFGYGSDTVLIHGGIHGNEPTSATVAEALVELLKNRPELYTGKTVGIVPVVNPDGTAAGTRENARGVDLNRNFPATNWRLAKDGNDHGHRAASEPETLALIRAMKIVKPKRIIALHSIRRGKHCNNFDGPADYYAQLLNEHNGYRVAPSMGYPTPGSFGTWAGVDQRIPTITLEFPRDASHAECWRDNKDALVAFIQSTGK